MCVCDCVLVLSHCFPMIHVGPVWLSYALATHQRELRILGWLCTTNVCECVSVCMCACATRFPPPSTLQKCAHRAACHLSTFEKDVVCFVRLQLWVCACVCACACVCIYVHMCVCARACSCVCACACTWNPIPTAGSAQAPIQNVRNSGSCSYSFSINGIGCACVCVSASLHITSVIFNEENFMLFPGLYSRLKAVCVLSRHVLVNGFVAFAGLFVHLTECVCCCWMLRAAMNVWYFPEVWLI